MHDAVRVGIVGAGVIAATHADAIRSRGDAVVVAVHDVDRSRAEAAAERWGGGISVLASMDDLATSPGVDAVIVATPPWAHEGPVVAALGAGKHVLCEKPLSRSLAGAEAIAAAEARSTAVLTVASGRLRCSPAHQRAEELIAAGELGEVYHAHISMCLPRNRPGHHVLQDSTWFLDKERAGGGALLDIGVYLVDAALALLGHPRPVSVSAQAWQFESDHLPTGVRQDVEDSAVVLIRCDNGAVATIESAWISHMAPVVDARVRGTRAGLRLDPLTLVTPGQPSSTGSGLSEQAILHDVEDGYLATANLARLTHRFLDSLSSGAPAITSGAESLEVMRVLDAAYRSAAAGSSVEIAATGAVPPSEP